MSWGVWILKADLGFAWREAHNEQRSRKEDTGVDLAIGVLGAFKPCS